MPTSNRTSSDRRAARRAKMTPAQADADRAKLAAKKRKQRFKRYFEREYGRLPDGPDDERDLRRMMRGHPCGCACFDCLWEPDASEQIQPRMARVATA